MKFVLWILLALALLYVLLVVLPGLAAFFVACKRKNPEDLSEAALYADPLRAPHMNEILEGIQDFMSMPFEVIETKSADGQRLSGYYLDAGSTKTVLFFHGYASTPANDFGVLFRFFLKEGFNLLFVTERGTRESGGKYITFGFSERLDVKSWTRYAERRGAEEILLYGTEMGATAVALGLDRVKNSSVRAAVLESPALSPMDQYEAVLRERTVPPFYLKLISPIARGMAYILFRGDLSEGAEGALGRTKIPVFLLQQGADEEMLSKVKAAFETVRAPKMKLIVKEGTSHTAYLQAREKAEDMLHTFIQAGFEG